jgi:hypothetical protein
MTEKQQAEQRKLKNQWDSEERLKVMLAEADSTGKGAKGSYKALSNLKNVLVVMLRARLCLVHELCMDAG